MIVWLPAATFVKVKGEAPGTGAPPSRVKVYGAVPLVGVTVILPFEAPLHEVAVDVVAAIRTGPGFTITLLIVRVHPKLSVMMII